MLEKFSLPPTDDQPRTRVEIPVTIPEEEFLKEAHLEALLKNLTPQERRVMLLAYDLGGTAEPLSPNEIAEQLRLPVHQVQTIIFTSLQKMRLTD